MKEFFKTLGIGLAVLATVVLMFLGICAFPNVGIIAILLLFAYFIGLVIRD